MIKFGIVGQYQSGKSLLINCLLKRYIATVGNGVATTHTVVNYKFSEIEFVTIVYVNGRKVKIDVEKFANFDINTSVREINVYLNNLLLKDYELTDIPGFGYDANDNEVASRAINSIDVAILIASNQKTIGIDSPAYFDLCKLEAYNIPYYFILNCTDFIIQNKWSPHADTNKSIINDYIRLSEQYKPLSYPLDSNQLPIVNLMWYWYSINDENDTLLQREENQNAINIHRLYNYSKEDIKQASCFNLIEKIFSMENRLYLELKRDFKEELAKLRDEVCPVGTIQAFAFNRIPNGWMICDGRSLDPEVHSELFRAIGTTFGGDGKISFAIPDLRGRFIRGWSTPKGDIDKVRQFGSEQSDALQNHQHQFNVNKILINSSGEHSHTARASTIEIREGVLSSVSVLKWLVSSGSDTGETSSNGGHNHQLTLVSNPISNAINANCAHESRPVNIALLYCIKVGLQDE